ncbi:MAG: hypothetical protein K6U04_06720 [Armatimonadetes bacterium]|nr:hypothetical protein [Armatimonadota bacterium]
MGSLISHVSGNGYYAKAGNYSYNRNIGGLAVSASALDVGRVTRKYEYSIKKLNFEAEASKRNKYFSIGGEASLAKYSGSYNISGGKIKIGGSAALGSVGVRVSAGKNHFKVYAGIGAVGLGVSLDVRR